MTSTFSDGTAFTTAMRSAMKTNGVTSVAVDDITSDTSSSVPANAGTTGATVPNTNNNSNNDADNNNSDEKTDPVWIVVVVLLVVIGLSCAGGCMFAKSQKKNCGVCCGKNNKAPVQDIELSELSEVDASNTNIICIRQFRHTKEHLYYTNPLADDGIIQI